MFRVVVQRQVVLVVIGGEVAYLETGVGEINRAFHQKIGLVAGLAAFEQQPSGAYLDDFDLALNFLQVRFAQAVKGNEILETRHVGDDIAHC